MKGLARGLARDLAARARQLTAVVDDADVAQLAVYAALGARLFAHLGHGEGRDVVRSLVEGEPKLRVQLDAALAQAGEHAALDLDAVDLAPLIELDDGALGALYEGFIKHAAPDGRRARGVYFTPPDVADFVVRQVDVVLRDEVGFANGLVDAFDGRDGVRVCDPAAGAGAFLTAVVRSAHATFIANARREDCAPEAAARAWRTFVAERLLPGLLGIELAPAACLACRIHLAVALVRTGIELPLAARVDVRLADALATEPPSDTRVVLMNPPYRRGQRGVSTPLAYREAVRGERNVQPLSDAYLAFIALAERWLAHDAWAVVGMVTNATFLAGRLHRGVRESLLVSFPHIDVLDLGGGVRSRRPPPGQPRDENVFPIAQPVAATVLRRMARQQPRVRYAALRGRRVDKLRRLREGELPTLQRLDSLPPQRRFVPSEPVPDEYEDFVALDALFTFHSVGGKPGRDRVLVGFTRDEVIAQLRDAKQRLRTASPATLTEAERKLASHVAEHSIDSARVLPYLYRPFDVRWVYDDPRVWTRPVTALREHLDGQPALLTTRIVNDPPFAHVFAARSLPDVIALSPVSAVNCHVFPASCLRVEVVERALGHGVEPATAFAYIYGVLHSAAYRLRYAAAFAVDFPRVPFTRDRGLFDAVAEQGAALLALHLGDVTPALDLAPRFVDGSDRVVRRVGERGRRLSAVSGANGVLSINDRSRFVDVALRCWEVRIGGYQVCHKWLDDRRRAARTLADGEVEAYRDLVARIAATLRCVDAVDAAIDDAGGLPGKFR